MQKIGRYMDNILNHSTYKYQIMMRLVLRRTFCTLPAETKITETQISAKVDFPSQITEQIDNQLRQVEREIRIERINHHRNTELNFAEWEDGKMPVVQVDYSNARLMSFSNIHTYTSLASLATIPFMPSIYYAAGSLAYFGFALYSNLPNITEKVSKKINSISLLQDGYLEIQVSDSNSFQTLVVSKEQFCYGQYNTDSNNWLKFLKTEGVWCTVNGQNYLLGSNRIVNQHYFNELL